MQWKQITAHADYIIYEDGTVFNTKTRRRVCGHVEKRTGYQVVGMRINGQSYPFRVHKLVAEHFLGSIPDGYDVHHKDDDPQNNHVDNLELVEHGKHRREHGIGKRSHNASLTNEEVLDIRKRYANGQSQDSISTTFGLSQAAISKIVRLISYSDVVKEHEL